MDVNEKILKIFKGFIIDLRTVFPEHIESLDRNYKTIIDLDELIIDENEIIKEFLQLVEDNSDNITNKNDSIFTDELYLIKEISMKSIWDSDISDKTRTSIWNYLQSFCLLNITINSNDKINEVLKSIESNEKVKDKKTLKEMKKVQKINENIKNDIKPDSTPMDTLLENSTIGNLAKKITKDLNIDDMDEEDMGAFFKPENMMNIFQKINSTITEKIENKELDGDELLGEATNLMNGGDMMSNMMSMLSGMGKGGGGGGDTPDLSGMMSMLSGTSGFDGDTPDLSGMMSMLSGMGGAGAGADAPDLSGMMSMLSGMGGPTAAPTPPPSSDGNHNPDVIKARLRKKLNSKK